MSRININGIEYYECLDCGHWTNGLCKCREESKSRAIVKLLNMCRKKYNIPMFVTPYTGSGKQ